jgi:hypothetical protein
VRHFVNAGAAPGAPHIDDQNFAFEVGLGDRLPLDVDQVKFEFKGLRGGITPLAARPRS